MIHCSGCCIVATLLLPLAAVGLHFILFFGVDAPPSDHGSGTMFDLIAPRYDRINRVMSAGMDISWRQRLVQEIVHTISDEKDVHVLDVATGTADVALLLAMALPQAHIVGVDASANMLAVGWHKIKAAQLDNVKLAQHDARDLSPLPSHHFAAATMAFGIRNVVPHREMALCEIHRVLQPDRRFCILEFSEPDDSFGVLGKVARVFIRHVVPVLGGILSGRPREYLHLQHSIQDFTMAQFIKTLHDIQCATGTFVLDDIIQLNYGSVQLYVTRTRPAMTTTMESTADP